MKFRSKVNRPYCFTKAYISFGANLPFSGMAPKDTLQAAMKTLDHRDLQLIRSSSLWSSPSWPDADEPTFVNAVALYMCCLTPLRLMNRLARVENNYGRVRSRKNAPRTLDLDLISYGQIRSSTKRVMLPHPRMHTRAFVLLPLAELDPDWQNPETGVSVEQMVTNLTPQDHLDTKVIQSVQIDIA